VRFLLVSARKDIRRILADPLALLLWIGIPTLIGLLMAAASGGGESDGPKVVVLLVDEDDTLLTRMIAAGSDEGPAGLGGLFTFERVDAAEGRRRIDAGDGTALLTLPAGFTKALLEEQPTRLELVTNPAQRILPEILTESLELLIEASFYAHRLIGEPVREFVAGLGDQDEFPTDAAVAGMSAAINARMRGLEDVLFPPVLALEKISDPEADEEPFSFGRLFLPGVVFMALLFIAQGISDDLWKEKQQGTLVRALAAPHGLVAFLGGKLVASAFVMGVVSLAALGLGIVQYDLPVEAVLWGVPWCAFAGTVLLALFFLIQVFASSQRGGNVLGTVVIFPLMMLGGSFFPFEAMPDWMVAVGRWTPNGRALIELKTIVEGSADVTSVALSGAVMGGMAVLALFVCALRLRRRFAVS